MACFYFFLGLFGSAVLCDALFVVYFLLIKSCAATLRRIYPRISKPYPRNKRQSEPAGRSTAGTEPVEKLLVSRINPGKGFNLTS